MKRLLKAIAIMGLSVVALSADVNISGVTGIGAYTATPTGVDPAYTFTYVDNSGDFGFGTLNAIPSGLPDDGLSVLSGTLNLITSSDGNASVGTYSLVTPIGPGVQVSPSGAFLVDNLIYPNNDAAGGYNPGMTSNPSYLTLYGLLFGQPATGNQTEINIFGNGGGDYAFYSWTSAGGYNNAVGTSGIFTLTATAPEPAEMLPVMIGMLAIAGAVLKLKLS